MPTNLDNLQGNVKTAVKTYSPHFFDLKLTGRGGASNVGLLSMKNNPANIPPEKKTLTGDYTMSKRIFRNGTTTVTMLPINPICKDAWELMHEIERPDLATMIKIAEYPSKNIEVYLDMNIHALSLEENVISTLNQGTKTERRFTTAYQVMLYYTKDVANTKHKRKTDAYMAMRENAYKELYTSNPLGEASIIYHELEKEGYNVNAHVFETYLASYDLYTSVTERSRQWQETIDKSIDILLSNVQAHNASPLSHSTMRTLEYQMRYLMNYNIPLDLYKNIYASLKAHLAEADAVTLCKQNLNLLLSDTLNNLSANKTQLVTFQPPAPPAPMPASVQHLSQEQIRAVTSTEPLILVQAGAGTGKSTLILGRIDYLTACGVKPSDITVLSFTNAAADHITEKNPNVNSMTIARMIHEIYSANFTGHELSSLDTIINSLDIYYAGSLQKNGVVSMFKNKLIAMNKNEANNCTEMNNFIEANYDAVIDILDTIHQTSLELEIIICYQKIATLKEPASITSRFLIIDEVQDNSVFEFIYMLKYIDKHKESMFIVGDCSQTLYEFRASNPRALNILEGSGTFATYQLNVNYRSNQEILSFANVLLQNIEANQYARIQLQANSLRPVTEQSFLEHVSFNYQRLAKIGDFSEKMPSIIAREVAPYIKDKLAKKEQIAFLAFTRNNVANLEHTLSVQFPNAVIANLVPKKMYNSTVMSTFIKRYWETLKFAPVANLQHMIVQEIMNNLTYITYSPQKAAPAVQKMLAGWKADEGHIIDAWIKQAIAGQISQKDLMNFIKENMLQYEIRTNAVKQALLSADNAKTKQSQDMKNADILLSTIHSAKGLEFDNVVVLYRNESNMPEDKKRMYYVALTRAMKSEYVLAYDTMASPQILADYNSILEELHKIAPAPNSPLNVIPKGKRVSI